MINFPEATLVHRRMPKEAFYRNLSLTAALKEKFVSDVERIYVENSLTKDNLNLQKDSDVKEILLLSITLKKQVFDGKVVEAIARQNPHRLVFLLQYGSHRQFAIYHGKLYRTRWMDEDELQLNADGFSLDEIWDGLIEQIALCEERAEVAEELTVEERLALQEKILKLEKQIQKAETAAWKETQPKKKFDLFTRLQKYQKELEALKGTGGTIE